MAGFPDILIKSDITEVSEWPKHPISALNNMAIHVQRHAKVSKQTTILNGVDIGQPKWRICGRSLNRFVNEDMKDISNVKIHLKTRRGNVIF